MFSFNQFVNESKDHEFESIEKGDLVRYAATRYEVKKVNDGSIVLDGKHGDLRVNKNMWKQRNGIIIEKKKDSNKDEK
jgi:hypothetical protein